MTSSALDTSRKIQLRDGRRREPVDAAKVAVVEAVVVAVAAAETLLQDDFDCLSSVAADPVVTASNCSTDLDDE